MTDVINETLTYKEFKIFYLFIYLFLTFGDGGDKGKGQTIVIGEGNHATVEINFLRLVFGGNLKGSIFGGLKVKTDLPVIIEKCKNKVNSYGKKSPINF
jgi:hypothetical protein